MLHPPIAANTESISPFSSSPSGLHAIPSRYDRDGDAGSSWLLSALGAALNPASFDPFYKYFVTEQYGEPNRQVSSPKIDAHQQLLGWDVDL